jgi:hypothetical protein
VLLTADTAVLAARAAAASVRIAGR